MVPSVELFRFSFKQKAAQDRKVSFQRLFRESLRSVNEIVDTETFRISTKPQFSTI